MKHGLQKNALLFTICLFFGFFVFPGCSQLPKTIQDIGFPGAKSTGSDPHLSKKVGLAPLINMTAHQDPMDMKTLESMIFSSLASTCSNTIFIIPYEDSSPDFLSELPRRRPSGIIDSMALAQEAGKHGINLVIVPVLTEIVHEEQRLRFRKFREEKDLIRLAVRMEIYNAHTGAKIFHDTFIEEARIKSIENDNLAVPEIMKLTGFEKISGNLVESASKTICASLRDHPWIGFIVSAQGSSGVISSGSDVGIKNGQQFFVYENKGVISGYGGNQFLLPGSVVDQVRVVETASDHANVTSVSGKNLEKGNVIRTSER